MLVVVAIVTWKLCYGRKPSDHERGAVIRMSSRMLERTSRLVTGTEVHRRVWTRQRVLFWVLRIGSALLVAAGPFPTDFINWLRLGVIRATYAIHIFMIIVGRLPSEPLRMSCWYGAAVYTEHLVTGFTMSRDAQ